MSLFLCGCALSRFCWKASKDREEGGSRVLLSVCTHVCFPCPLVTNAPSWAQKRSAGWGSRSGLWELQPLHTQAWRANPHSHGQALPVNLPAHRQRRRGLWVSLWLFSKLRTSQAQSSEGSPWLEGRAGATVPLQDGRVPWLGPGVCPPGGPLES